MNPEAKYETNIIRAPVIDFVEGTLLRLLIYSSADCSDKKLPTPIEKASTKINMIPVNKIVDLGTLAAAIPDKSPTVETKLSSTPNMKLRTYSAEVRFGPFILSLPKTYHNFVGVPRIELGPYGPQPYTLPLNYTPINSPKSEKFLTSQFQKW